MSYSAFLVARLTVPAMAHPTCFNIYHQELFYILHMFSFWRQTTYLRSFPDILSFSAPNQRASSAAANVFRASSSSPAGPALSRSYLLLSLWCITKCGAFNQTETTLRNIEYFHSSTVSNKKFQHTDQRADLGHALYTERRHQRDPSREPLHPQEYIWAASERAENTIQERQVPPGKLLKSSEGPTWSSLTWVPTKKAFGYFSLPFANNRRHRNQYD